MNLDDINQALAGAGLKIVPLTGGDEPLPWEDVPPEPEYLGRTLWNASYSVGSGERVITSGEVHGRRPDGTYIVRVGTYLSSDWNNPDFKVAFMSDYAISTEFAYSSRAEAVAALAELPGGDA